MPNRSRSLANRLYVKKASVKAVMLVALLDFCMELKNWLLERPGFLHHGPSVHFYVCFKEGPWPLLSLVLEAATCGHDFSHPRLLCLLLHVFIVLAGRHYEFIQTNRWREVPIWYQTYFVRFELLKGSSAALSTWKCILMWIHVHAIMQDGKPSWGFNYYDVIRLASVGAGNFPALIIIWRSEMTSFASSGPGSSSKPLDDAKGWKPKGMVWWKNPSQQYACSNWYLKSWARGICSLFVSTSSLGKCHNKSELFGQYMSYT